MPNFDEMKTLVVVPSERISDYEKKGMLTIKEYYNPNNYFDVVYCVSAWEAHSREAHGLKIIPVKSGRDFRRKLKSIKPDLVRAYGGYKAAELACLNKLPNVPVVVSLHDPVPNRLYHSVNYADAIICMSKALLEIAKSRYEKVENINYLPNRLYRKAELKTFNESESYEPKLLFVGRLTQAKNLDTVIRALKYLSKWKLTIVGSGDREKYEKLAQKNGVESQINWIESLPNDQIAKLMKNHSVFCVPSKWEGFGVVFLEAVSVGIPVVTSDIPPMNEYLSRDVVSFVKDYENPSVLAKNIESALNKPSDKLIDYAKHIQEKFSYNAVASNEIEIYRSVLDHRTFKKSPNAIHSIAIKFFDRFRRDFYRVVIKLGLINV